MKCTGIGGGDSLPALRGAMEEVLGGLDRDARLRRQRHGEERHEAHGNSDRTHG